MRMKQERGNFRRKQCHRASLKSLLAQRKKCLTRDGKVQKEEKNKNLV